MFVEGAVDEGAGAIGLVDMKTRWLMVTGWQGFFGHGFRSLNLYFRKFHDGLVKLGGNERWGLELSISGRWESMDKGYKGIDVQVWPYLKDIQALSERIEARNKG